MNNNGEKKEYGRKDDAGDERREAERGELDRCADRRGAGVVDGSAAAGAGAAHRAGRGYPDWTAVRGDGQIPQDGERESLLRRAADGRDEERA